jgi:hypothetical protein
MVRLDPRAARTTDAVRLAAAATTRSSSRSSTGTGSSAPQQLATQSRPPATGALPLDDQFLADDAGGRRDLARRPRTGELRIRSAAAGHLPRRADAADLDALVEAFEELAEDLAMGDAACLVQIPFWAPAERPRERLAGRWSTTAWTSDQPWLRAPRCSREEALVRGADATIVSADRLWDKWKGTAPRLIRPRTASTPSTTERSMRATTCWAT